MHGRQLRYRTRLKLQYALRRYCPRSLLFILAEPRTGSNLLIDYLRCVPRVYAQEEILNDRAVHGLRRNWISRGGTLRHIAYSMNHDAEIVVAKLMLHHLRWRRVTAADLVRRYENGRFIVLYRENLARQYLSSQILFRTHVDRMRKESDRFTGRIRIDPREFVRYCEVQKRDYEAVLTTPGLRERAAVLSYEELATEPQRIIDGRILPLIEVPSVPVSTSMRKQNDRPLEEMVENYADVATVLNSELARHCYQ